MDVEILRGELMQAVEDMTSRGLRLSAKWASEQLLGMKPPAADCGIKEVLLHIGGDKVPSNERSVIHFADLLISTGEFQRCAHILRNRRAENSLTSKLGLFLMAYSLYMAGEKLKDQTAAEKMGVSSGQSSPLTTGHNPFLKDIFDDLYPLYLNTYPTDNRPGSGSVEGRGRGTDSSVGPSMDGHLLYLFGVVVRDLRVCGGAGVPHPVHRLQSTVPGALGHVPNAYTILFQSVQMYPFNWSCWLEIANGYTSCGGGGAAAYSSSPRTSSSSAAALPPFPDWLLASARRLTTPSDRPPPGAGVDGSSMSEQTTGSLQSSADCMCAMFLAQLLIEQQKGSAALRVLALLEIVFPTSQVVLSQVALAHYGMRDYPIAQEIFERNRLMDPYRLEHLDTFSNILYVKERKAELSHLAHTCVKVDKYRPETCCIIGNYYSLKGHHEKAVINFQRALKVDKRCLSAWTLMGHEYVELRNTSAAVQCYRHAVDVDSGDYRAWYGLGQTYEMLHLHQYSLYYYRRAASLRPTDARMWCAVGNCLSRLGGGGFGGSAASRDATLRTKREAIAAYRRAVCCDDREGTSTRELARLYREMGDNTHAAEFYGKHLTAREMNPLVGEVTRHQYPPGPDEAVERRVDPSLVDPDAAEGLLFLATHYYDLGHLRAAEEYCLLLMDYRGPEGQEAKSILKAIRSSHSVIMGSPSLASVHMSYRDSDAGSQSGNHDDLFLLDDSEDDVNRSLG